MTPTIAFIPARGGSKGIPRKNVRLLAGRPLLYWSLDAAVGCPGVDRVVVSTDDAEIKSVVEAYGHGVEVVGRSPETATDTASTESALLEFAEAEDFGHVVLLQATSPFTTAGHIGEALDLLYRSEADSIVSVTRQMRFVWELADEGHAVPVNYKPSERPRRQAFDGMLVENGAVYITSREGLVHSGCRLNGRVAAYEMPARTYHEIDDEEDWAVVEALFSREIGVGDARAQSVKLFLTDVDGVLTDSGMYYSEQGDESKKFNTRDGKGLDLLRQAGIQTGIITGECTELVARRAKKLHIDHVFQGVSDKRLLIDTLSRETGVALHEMAYIGDDLNDLEAMQMVGLAAAPADAVGEIQAVADYVCQARGGEGCVREWAEWILRARSAER